LTNFLAKGERPGARQDQIAVQSRVEKHIEIAQIRDKALVPLWIDRVLIAMKNHIYPFSGKRLGVEILLSEHAGEIGVSAQVLANIQKQPGTLAGGTP
jgi:hypothetical protein